MARHVTARCIYALMACTTVLHPSAAVAQQLPVQLPPAVPSAAALSMEDAIRTALQGNPQRLQSAYSVLSARENYNSQKAPINPTFQYSALNNTVAPLDWASGFGLRSNYSVYATLETNGAQRFRASQAREQMHQAAFDAATVELSIRFQAASAYVGLQAANKQLEIERTVVENTRKLMELTHSRQLAGAGTEADYRRANIAYIQEQQNLAANTAAVLNARAALNAVLGRALDTPIDTASPLEYRLIPPSSLTALTRQAEALRPELQSARANLKALQAVPGLSRSAYFPDVIVGRDFGKGSVFNVGMSVPLDLGSIRGSVRKADADVKAQMAQVEASRQGVDLDVKTSLLTLEAAQTQLATYTSEAGLVNESQKLFEQTRQAYLLGANSLLDVITAEDTYKAVLSSYWSAIGSCAQADLTLKHATGELLQMAPVLPASAASEKGPNKR
jgi:outer membrane protein, heavy metal efflux system